MPLTTEQEEALARRVELLVATDPQFAAARPDPAVNTALEQSGHGLTGVIRTVLDGYADRPALGQRAVEYVADPATGRTSALLLPRFETITYAELRDRIERVARALLADGLRPGDRVCILGFTGIDYTTVDMALAVTGAVSVPLQTSASVSSLQPIVAETEPILIVSDVNHLDHATDLIRSGAPARGLLVFDYHWQIDDHREAVEAAAAGLAESGVPVDTLSAVLERATALPRTALSDLLRPELPDDAMAMLIYTSGSTGAPKGAIYPRRNIAKMFRRSSKSWVAATPASITLNFMPMSHTMGRGALFGTLGNGGIAYFTAKSDLSTLIEDFALVRPTEINLVPRIWETLHSEYLADVDRRCLQGSDRDAVAAEVLVDHRERLLGGRFIFAMTGSAPTSPELTAWVESLLQMHLLDGYGSTEAGMMLSDGTVQKPPVLDYRLIDVPDLGYFGTDRPSPRGELLVKTENMFSGYYRRPEITDAVFDEQGYFRTGDIFAETAPGKLVYLDRRNNVLKLAQGEFVTLATLEAAFGNSPLIRQIYVYGNSAQSYLLAVVVPTESALADYGIGELKPAILDSLRTVARDTGLQSFEVPRDVIIETTPFSLENGLLTGIRKLAWPKLKAQYGPRLEALYAELARGTADTLSALRHVGADAPVLSTVTAAAAALLGSPDGEVGADVHFTDLGGDSLSALTFGTLLQEIFAVEVPVGVIVSPANDMAAIAAYIDSERAGTKRPSFTTVHGRDASAAHARDLTLEKFIDAATLAAAPHLPGPVEQVRTVLLTGATGFLGRYLALELLEQMHGVGGTVIALVRGKSVADARARLDATFDTGDRALSARYRELAAEHLEVIVGDKGEANLGLDPQTWNRLAETVDAIVDPAALVNHVLPYSELFGPNALGTAELIRIALTSRLKPFTYVSTVAVGMSVAPGEFVEDADVRVMSPTRPVDDSYANGYGTSKWAGEVLLREAHDLCGLPVAVFRCGMILADTSYAGQLNLPDMFTRLLLSVVATGIAPGSFYELDAAGRRQRAHYDGLPVGFIAEAITTLHPGPGTGFQTFHVMNGNDDGIGLDEYVDWLTDAGYRIERIADYQQWLNRFDTALRGLPERQRRHSLLPLLHNYQQPEPPVTGATAPTDRFRAAVREAKVGPEQDIPHIDAPLIVKYLSDLELLGVL